MEKEIVTEWVRQIIKIIVEHYQVPAQTFLITMSLISLISSMA